MNRKPIPFNVRRVVHIDGNARGVFTSKSGELIQYESFGELKLYILLERNPRILKYRSQPERLYYTDDKGKERSYVPDCQAWWDNGDIVLYEVTISSRRSQPTAIRREKAGREICARRGWRYVPHTEKSLPNDTEMANLLTLYYHRAPFYYNEAVVGQILARLEPNNPILLRVIVTEVARAFSIDMSTVRCTLFHLLWHNKIETDLNKLILIRGLVSPSMTIWAKNEGDITDV